MQAIELEEHLVSGLKESTDAATFQRMGEYLLERIREGMRAERAPDGTPWKPRKKVKGREESHPLLRRSGRLYDSLRCTFAAGQARVSTQVAYAGVHQHGSGDRAKGKGAGGKGIVARPYMFNSDGTLPPEWKEGMAEIFLQKLKVSLEE